MRILIAGATGLVGQELVALCHQNDIAVNYLSTRKSKLSTANNYKGFFWNPESGEIDGACFKDVEVIINLAGASISKRWTKSYKKEILHSRLDTASCLFTSIKKHNIPIKHYISASAIGIYPNSLTNYYEEDFKEASDSFLGEVSAQWELAAKKFESIGVSVSLIRTGLVLSNKGGALPEIVKPVKLFAGAAFGSGKQWQSWIHITDLARIFVFVVEHQLEGTFNAVAPNAVSNSELIKAVASTLNKPLFLPNVPKFAMQLVLGEMHILLFESQRVSSQKIEEEGFDFQFPNLKPALQDIIG
ncbi:TIGR01777 family oxidoreductase [Paucihalobacter sp.]|uniref:TIGR01777 family oxidoreductase n=1 Tax=Paucihalobacter sp. TaxID=2850405 RepID=UPI003D1615A6